MNQLRRLLASLSVRQRVSLAVAAAAVVAGLAALNRWNTERDFRPLYTGMAPEDAGAVVTRLRESGVEYRLGENGTTVLAPSAKIAELRLQMASAGLPKSGRTGFELFDRTNFGASDFTEQVNYHRALEGELERSVTALAEVEQARVHITMPKDSVFLESRQPAKASVMLKLRPGARLSPQNVAAIRHLAASAVPGLDPEAVSVLDTQGNLLGRPKREPPADGSEPSEAALEFRQGIERDLLAKINSTLDPLLGPDKFRAGVFVDCDFTSGEQSEETLDPSRSVMLTSQKTEDISGASSASGVPGTASNLPRPTSRPGSAAGGVTRRTENITFQTSRTVRRVRLPQGTLKRMSVSVLVDHAVRWEGAGNAAKRVVEPPGPEKLKVIRDLVAAATGFVAERGDQLIIESLPFASTLAPEAPPAGAPSPAPATPPNLPPWRIGNKMFPVLTGIGAAVLLFLLASAVLLLRRGRLGKTSATVQPALPGGAPPAIAPSEQSVKERMQAKLAEQAALKQRLEQEALNSLKLPPVTTKKTEVLAKHISEEAKKEPAAIAQIVRGWLNEA